MSYRLQPPGPVTVGRRSTNALQLNDPAVSRDHARFSFRGRHATESPAEGEWLLDDMGSTHGTWLNGTPLKRSRQYHVRAGDLIVIGPWTLCILDRNGPAAPGTTLPTLSDTAASTLAGGTVVTPVEAPADTMMPARALELLQRCSERTHGAGTETAVAEAVLDAAIAGTSFGRAVFLRPMTDENLVEIIAFRGQGFASGSTPELSRALIQEAASGSAARLQRGRGLGSGTPVTSRPAEIAALCVPIVVESTVAGFVYLDKPLRAAASGSPRPEVERFALALGRLAAMGVANLMHLDMARRQERIEAELDAAAEAQRWLLPQREGRHGPFTFVGETRPGQCVGGDLYDIIPLDDDRLGVVFGDVSGKGIPVSILVSASQGFLHACLEDRSDPAHATASMNRLYHHRIARARFLKLWIGIFDARERALLYTAAGHGCVMMVLADGTCELLAADQNLPVGIKAEIEYQVHRVAVTPGTRTLILSDGFLEQRAQDHPDEHADNTSSPTDEDRLQRFGLRGVQDCLRGLRVGEDEVAALFRALEEYAGTAVPDDDATAVLIRW